MRKRIIALAYFHRYGWIAAMLIFRLLLPVPGFLIACIGCLIYSVWSFIGYKCKWRHIYCSYQNAYHEKITPDRINWHRIRKSDVYIISSIFFLLSVALFLAKIAE